MSSFQETRTFEKMFANIILLFKRVKALNNFLDKLDTSKTEEAETKNSVCDLKNI